VRLNIPFFYFIEEGVIAESAVDVYKTNSNSFSDS